MMWLLFFFFFFEIVMEKSIENNDMAELRYHEWNVDKAIKINGSRSWSELIEQAFKFDDEYNRLMLENWKHIDEDIGK